MMTLKASGTDWSSTLRKNPVTSSDQWVYGSAVGLDSTEPPFVIIAASSGSLFHKAVLPVCWFLFVPLVFEFFCLPAALFQTTTGTSL